MNLLKIDKRIHNNYFLNLAMLLAKFLIISLQNLLLHSKTGMCIQVVNTSNVFECVKIKVF